MKKLAIIGCGGIGGYHLTHFLEFKDIELAGFCDLIPERAEAFVKRAGQGRAFTNFIEMYDAVAPDMVFVCVPPYCHGEIEFETIRRGIPMFIEKPLALDMGLANEICAEVEKKQLITAAGFQCRYSNLVDATLEYARENQIVFVGCARMGGLPMVDWWRVKPLSGGQIVEQTIHQFDMIRYVMGEPAEVFTMGARGFVTGVPDYDTDDLSTTSVRFVSGALGAIATGCYAENGEAYDSKISFGARGSRLDHYIIDKVRVYGAAKEDGGLVFGGDGTMSASSGEALVISDDGQAGVRCDRTFIDAAISGDASKIRSPYADALRSVAFTLACNRSMAEGRAVRL